MKQICSILFVMIMLSCIFSCNNADQSSLTENKRSSTQLETIGFFDDSSFVPVSFISTKLAQDLVRNFDTLYRKKGTEKMETAFQLDHWVDLSVIKAFHKFLNSDNSYDGFRIHYAANTWLDPESYPGRLFQTKSHIILVPTKDSLDVWGKPITEPEGIYEFRYFNWEEKYAKERINAFGAVYREERNVGDHLGEAKRPYLSSSVWFSRDVIDVLVAASDSILKWREKDNTIPKMDGVRFYSAAYRELNPLADGQKYPKQTTFIIVPTVEDGLMHRDNWDILQESKKDSTTLEFYAALNHGQLCPNKCR